MKASIASFIGQALLTLLMVAAALLLYDQWVLRPALSVGVVDVAEVYRTKEAEFTRILTQNASDEEHQSALRLARHFAQRLPVALDELPRDCGCLVVLKSAIAGASPRAVDLTPLLRRKVEGP